MSKEKTALTQTKGTFRLRGIVAGKSYKKEVVANGKKNAGREYRNTRILLKTSSVNSVYAEMFGIEKDTINVFKRDEQTSGGPRKKSESKSIPFAKRHSVPEGFHIIDTSLSLEENAEGKLFEVNLMQFDAVDYIHEHLKDGDSVYVSGNIEISEYTNEFTKQSKTQTKYYIKKIEKLEKPINFEAADFEEVSAFEQEIVFMDKTVDGSRIYVTGRTIKYTGDYIDLQFVVDPQGDKDIAKTAKAFAKSLKLGDFVKVNGILVNRVELEEVEEEVSEGLFGNKRANGYNRRPIKNFISEYQIVGADENSYEPGKYTKDDFDKEEFIDTSKSKNPFNISDEDDDLPF